MFNSTQSRRALLGLVLAASAAGTIAQAQDAARPVPPPPGGNGAELVVNCCRCLGQESGAANISSGTAPWRVSSVASAPWGQTVMTGPTNTSPLVVPGAISNPHPAWTTLLNPAKWLQPSSATTLGNFANGHVTYVLKIRVPNCTIKQKVIIAGQVATDDKGLMYVDGPGGGPIALAPASPFAFAGFGNNGVKSFSHQLGANSSGFTQPGTYTVRIEVDNLGGGPFGMILKGTAGGKCDDRLEKGKEDRADGCRDC